MTDERPGRKRLARGGLAASLLALLGPALVAVAPLEAPLSDTRVAFAWGATAIALCAAAFALTRAVGADRASAAFLLVVVYAGPIVVATGKALELAWTAQAQAVLERRWAASLGDGSVEALERAVSAEQELLASLARERIFIRPRVSGHEPYLDELRAYERARTSLDPAAWKEHEARAGLARARLELHGGHDEELTLVRGRDADLRGRLTALRVTGAERIAARSGAPGVDPAGARFLGAAVRGEAFEGGYRASPASDHVAVVLRDDLLVEGGPAVTERARERALGELAAIASACLAQPAFFTRAPEPWSGYEYPPALTVELALHRPAPAANPGARAVEVEARTLPATTTAIDVQLRARTGGGFWSSPEWELTTVLHVDAAPGTPIVEAAYLAAVRRVAEAMGLDLATSEGAR